MPRTGIVAGIDAGHVAASAVTIMHPPPPVGASTPGCSRLLGGAAAHPTLVHGATDDGLPYRVDLADPMSVARDSAPQMLSPRSSLTSVDGDELDACISEHAAATQFLVNQVSPRAPDRIGIVVPDMLDPDRSEALLRAMRSPRGRVELIPWPVAAAWAWLDKYGGRLAPPPEGRRSIEYSILTVHVDDQHWSAVPIHIVADPASVETPLVPARDRDSDGEEILHRWRDNASPQMSACDLATAIKDGLPDAHIDFAGLVVSGRSMAAEHVDETCASLGGLLGVSRSLADTACRVGLLSRGSALAAGAVHVGGVPYYETVPQIEVLGTTTSWAEELPHGLYDLPYWVNVLHGTEDLIDRRHLLPANRELEHAPSLPLRIQPGRTTITISFGRRNVRRIYAEVPGDLMRTEEVKLRVKYRLGSGRPRVFIARASSPNDPIVFDWSSAEHDSRARDEITTLDGVSVIAEHERRRDLRRAKGFSA